MNIAEVLLTIGGIILALIAATAFLASFAAAFLFWNAVKAAFKEELHKNSKTES